MTITITAYDEVVELEEIIQDKRGKFYFIHNQIPSMKEFKKQAENQLFTPEEMYPKIDLKTNCGVFCHR